jgi:putative tryptophan/tyrosine transport system substrate-binding protein
MSHHLARFMVILALSIFVVPLVAEAQPPPKVPRIGFLMPSLTSERARSLEAFRQGLRELGWIEGQNVTIELRYAEAGADTEQLPDLAADLVQLNVDVMVTVGGTTRVAQGATSTIPIVMATAIDPVAAGFVASLARPGGNITGLAGLGAELSGKRLEILKQAVPQLSRLALLLNPTNLQSAYLHETQVVAQALGVALQMVEVRRPDEIESAFAAMQRAGADALMLLTDSRLLEPHIGDITALALRSRLPAIYPWRMYVEAGGLMSYGISLREWYRRAATYVDKILKGAKPADLPVEQPMQFELVINLKTAKALGITIPPHLLVLADEVIQ